MLSRLLRAQPFTKVIQRLSLAVFVLSLISRLSLSQQIDSDTVDFSEIEIWNDLRSCLKTVFNTCGFLGGCSNNIALEAGCQTNACLCRDSTLGEAIGDAASLALAYCSNYDDQSTATSILTSYCSVRGYTEIVAPTTSTGASIATATVTATPTAMTATVTVTASSAADAVHTVPNCLLQKYFFLVVISSLLWT